MQGCSGTSVACVSLAMSSGSRMPWPSANAGSFARTTPQMQPIKMIRVPEVYVATHNTMPPLQQVIHAASMPTTLRELYQQADRKKTGKRDSTTVASERNIYEESRQAKTPRAN